MTEQEFHAARRMFIIFRGGHVLVASKGDDRSHFEWLAELFGSDTAHVYINNHTRGYVLGNKMVVYKGQDFSHWVAHMDVIHALDAFDRMTEGGITEIGLGVVVGGKNPWPARTTYCAKEYGTNVLRLAAEAHKREKANGDG